MVKTLESWGINIRKVVNDNNSRSLEDVIVEGIADGSLDPNGSIAQLRAPFRASVLDLIPGAADLLAKVDLTTDDAMEMLEDSGITLMDMLEVFAYIMSPASSPQVEGDVLSTLEERVEAPLYLMRYYENTLANWFLMGGFDVQYNNWGM